jgi:uncharacterized damage-inducible protein DinB
MARPDINTFPPYFNTYIKLVEDQNIKSALKEQMTGAEKFLNSITEEQSFHKYAEGKWSIKEVLQHIIDAERVFAYRAMAFARKDINALPSFDENSYAANSHADSRSWKELIEEFIALRKSTEMLFNSFTEDDLDISGKASNYEITVLALGYTTVGHATHHINLIRERYL